MTDGKKHIQRRLVEAAAVIRQDDPDAIEYQHALLCQVALPRKKTEARSFERTFKNASILIQAGRLWDGKKWVDQPLPYGPKPRLAMIHINGEAVRTQNPHVEIGRSCSDFLRRIGLPDQDGRTYALFKRQMMALSASELSLGFTLRAQAVTINTRPIDEFRAWISGDDRQPSLWPGELTLSQKYFDSLVSHAVPLDPRALGALAHSALALDVYSFLARRLHQLDKPLNISFEALKEQFGQEYTGEDGIYNFKRKFLDILKQVLVVYPAAKVAEINKGLLLSPSRSPVSKTIVSGRRLTQEPPLHLPPPQGSNLAERTIERFRSLYAGLDVYACKSDFDHWISGKDTPPANYDRAFLGFAKKWTRGKLPA